MAPLFWSIVALDALLLSALLLAMLRDPRPSDGGREMGIIFSILLPAAILGGAVLLFLLAESSVAHMVALVIAAGPGLLLTGVRMREAWIGHRIREFNSGRGYFPRAPHRALAAAVVAGDAATIPELAKGVDLDRVGERGMTLVGLALHHLAGDSASDATRLAVLGNLLAAGANPAAGLAEATRLRSPEALRLLLDANADPNHRREDGEAAIFEWLGVMPVESLQLLLGYRLDPNLVSRGGTPLPLAAAEQRRWDLLLLLLDLGARADVADQGGRTLKAFVAERLADERSSRSGPAPELLQVSTLVLH